ncbi:MAG TPA: flagellar motor stator protein MotA [Vicinamibacterales bacterium]
MLLILGVLVVLGSVAGGYMMHGGHLGVLWQPSELVIIGGAGLGAMLISTPLPLLKRIVSQVAWFFRPAVPKEDYLELLGMQYQLFKLVQQSGVMALESHFEDPKTSPLLSKYPRFLARPHAVDFLSDSVKVIIIGGISPHDLEALMDEDLEVHQAEGLKPASTLTRLGDSMPGLGIVAAVLGVVITMGAIDGPPSEIGHKVAAALVGTFLGILLCYGFFNPMGAYLEHVVHDQEHYTRCLKTGLLAVYKGFPPAIAVEFARRVLPPDVRPTFEETEQYCKGQRGGTETAAQAA